MKTCSKCGKEHSGTSRYCPPCWCEYQKNWYKNNPESTRESHRTRRKQRRDYIVSKKSNTPCLDCGKIYPWYVMDFDHVRGEKKFNLSIASNKMWSMEAIEEEMAKCDLVCANCHRIRTFTRTQLPDRVTGNSLGSEPRNLGPNPS